MRNMSFSITTAAFRARQKTVTRRIGWWWLTPGTLVMGVEQAMGLKRGQKVVPLGAIRILSVRVEPLQLLLTDAAYGVEECALEGFPHLKPVEFVEMFCRTHGCYAAAEANRIAFEYVD